MERKRKLPPRAAARVEQSAKKRAVTPSEASPTPSSTPAPAPASVASQKTPAPPEPPVREETPLPKSIQAGNPLPTVENAQPEDLSSKEYQSVQERYGRSEFSSQLLWPSIVLTGEIVVCLPSLFPDRVRSGLTRASSRNTGRNRRNAKA